MSYFTPRIIIIFMETIKDVYRTGVASIWIPLRGVRRSCEVADVSMAPRPAKPFARGFFCDGRRKRILASAEATLEQARSYDRAGQEAQCMDAIARAKQLAR